MVSNFIVIAIFVAIITVVGKDVIKTVFFVEVIIGEAVVSFSVMIIELMNIFHMLNSQKVISQYKKNTKYRNISETALLVVVAAAAARVVVAVAVVVVLPISGCKWW